MKSAVSSKQTATVSVYYNVGFNDGLNIYHARESKAFDISTNPVESLTDPIITHMPEINKTTKHLTH